MTDSDTCYVVFPRVNSRAKAIWYEARNKCLFEGGDLADEYSTGLPLPRNTDDKYLIGLRRGAFMWIEPSKLLLTRSLLAVEKLHDFTS